MHVALYERASKDEEDRRVSVSRQRSRCEALADSTFPGVPVVHYTDNNLSGADPDVERPQYQAMLAAIRRGEVSAVVCHEQSRLTRQPAQWDDLVVTLTKSGITKVHTVQGGIVPVEAGNRLVGRIMSVIDAEEVERTKARTLAAHQTLAAEGRPNGGRAYGYRRQTGPDGRPELVVDPDQAAVVHRVADQLCTGQSLSAVVASLNADGVPTPNGGKCWRTGAVRSILSKPAIAGFRTHRGEVVGQGRWEPILSEERWKAVRRALGSSVVYDIHGRPRKAARAHRSRGRRWLLTGGLAVCGGCKSPLIVGVQGRAGSQAYLCHTLSGPDACCGVSVNPAEVVEEVVVDLVFDAIESGRLAARLVANVDPERERLHAVLHDAEDTIVRAAQLRGAGDIDWTTWEAMHRPAKARADGAKAALAALDDPDVDLPPAEEARQRWEGLSLRQRRAFLDRYLQAVEVSPAGVRGRRPDLTSKERVTGRLTPVWRV
jgi:DNA invertase Pin-like site-specific DNA recombinase